MDTVKKILLVEDDIDDQMFFVEAISEIKSAVLFGIANNGKEALNKLKRSVILPDLIFTDIHMPVMNGIECLAEIIKDPQIRNIPVVILSTDKGKAKLAHVLGAKAFIEKPSDSKILREQLEHHINLNFIIDSNVVNQSFPTVLSAF